MSTFNARLSFKGEGELTVTLPVIGQISIWNGRDIFLKGATQEIIETLRQYRSMMLEHTLNGEAKGCYRVIEVNAIDRIPQNQFRAVAAPRTEHISALKAQMMKANELTKFDEEIISEAGKSDAKKFQEKEDNKQQEENNKLNIKEEIKVEDEEVSEDTTENSTEDTNTTDTSNISDNVVEGKLPENVANVTATVGKTKGKKISELNDKELRKVLRYAKSETERNAAQKALDILYPQN